MELEELSEKELFDLLKEKTENLKRFSSAERFYEVFTILFALMEQKSVSKNQVMIKLLRMDDV
jgi:DNA-binding transcriptional regulator GbsR (MarR family)